MSNVSAIELERLDKKGFAGRLGCSVSWIEKRMQEGMPHELIAGRVKFIPHKSEAWLEERGLLQRKGDES